MSEQDELDSADITEERQLHGLHMTALVNWAMHTIGAAIGWSLLAPLILVAVAAAADEPGILWLAALLGPGAFAWRISRADAPMPLDVES